MLVKAAGVRKTAELKSCSQSLLAISFLTPGNLICPVLAEYVFGGEVIRSVDEDRAVMIMIWQKNLLKIGKERGRYPAT